MARDVKFDVYHFNKTVLRHVEFILPTDRPSFENLVSHIRLKCDSENKHNLRYEPILYTNSEGDKVFLSKDADSLERFYTAICGQKIVNLEIPDWTNENNEKPFARIPGSLNKLNFRDLENLFAAKVDRNGYREVEKVANDHSVGTTFREYFRPSATEKDHQKFSTRRGMLVAKRISGQEVSRLLMNGSQILIPVDDNNFLSLSFSKDHPAYPALMWQNRSPEHYEARYQCERASFPGVIEYPANIYIPNEVGNVFRACEDNRKKPHSWPENLMQPQTRIQMERSMYPLLSIPPQPLRQYPPQFSPFSPMYNTTSRVIPHCYPPMNPPLRNQQTQSNPLGHPDYQKHIGPQYVRPNLECNPEDNIPAWFPRHMQDFKKDLIADVEKMLRIRNEETMSQKSDEQLGTEEASSAKNNPNNTAENNGSSIKAKEMIEGWEVVSEFLQNDSNPDPPSGASDCSDQPGNIPLLPENLRQESELPLIERKSPNSSNCAPEDIYDSDSSISLILDDSVEIDEVANKFDVIEIPRCFVRQLKESDEGSSNRVSVRVKRIRVNKSSASEMKSDPNAEMVTAEASPAPTSPVSPPTAETAPPPTSPLSSPAVETVTLSIAPLSSPTVEAVTIPSASLSSPTVQAVTIPIAPLSSMTKKTTSSGTDCKDGSNAPEQEKENSTSGSARCPTRRSWMCRDSENVYRPSSQTTKTERKEKDPKDDPNVIHIAAKFSNPRTQRNASKENSRRQFLQMKMKSRGERRGDSNPVSYAQPEQGKANTSAGYRADTENARPRQRDTENALPRQRAQPVNILHDKVFEMTNNVFKNVLNSVKIPHSNEVKESVQKVFEESMSAASRLIPNPMYTESVPPSENLNFSNPRQPSTSNNETSSPPNTTASNDHESRSEACANENDNASRFDELPDRVRADLILLNEMGFTNNGHNLFLLSKYPDDLEKVVESLVNFAVI